MATSFREPEVANSQKALHRPASVCSAETFIMAPGLIDPRIVTETPSSERKLIGPKEGFDGGRQSYNPAKEEKGTEAHPPATHPNYLPIWDESIKLAKSGIRGPGAILTCLGTLHLSRLSITNMAEMPTQSSRNC